MRSIVLAVLAVVCAGAGVLTVPVPVVGTLFSFAAPALALAGVIVGGIDLSRRRRASQPSEGPLIGVILSALAFFPALATTVTCGLCNALSTVTPVQVRRDIRFGNPKGNLPNVHFADGGTLPPPLSPSVLRQAADAGLLPAQPAQPGQQAPGSVPAIPPPPLPAGPRSR